MTMTFLVFIVKSHIIPNFRPLNDDGLSPTHVLSVNAQPKSRHSYWLFARDFVMRSHCSEHYDLPNAGKFALKSPSR